VDNPFTPFYRTGFLTLNDFALGTGMTVHGAGEIVQAVDNSYVFAADLGDLCQIHVDSTLPKLNSDGVRLRLGRFTISFTEVFPSANPNHKMFMVKAGAGLNNFLLLSSANFIVPPSYSVILKGGASYGATLDPSELTYFVNVFVYRDSTSENWKVDFKVTTPSRTVLNISGADTGYSGDIYGGAGDYGCMSWRWPAAAYAIGEVLKDVSIGGEILAVPNIITSLTGIPQYMQARLEWVAPASYSPITGYRIYRAVHGGTLALYDTVGAGFLNYVDAAIIMGTQYDYAVSSVNAVGESPISGIVTLQSTT
jgi:hypothetical protein